MLVALPRDLRGGVPEDHLDHLDGDAATKQGGCSLLLAIMQTDHLRTAVVSGSSELLQVQAKRLVSAALETASG